MQEQWKEAEAFNTFSFTICMKFNDADSVNQVSDSGHILSEIEKEGYRIILLQKQVSHITLTITAIYT